MKELKTSIEIDSNPHRVWQILTDFSSYPDWNPFIPSIEGAPVEGSRLVARLAPPDGMAMNFKPTVLAADAEREFRWLGRLLFAGLFDGEHYFIIESADDGRVKFTQGERFSGLLVPVMGLMGIYKKTLRGFEAMNEALKLRAEAA